MNSFRNILLILGLGFAGLGLLITLVFIGTGGAGMMIAIPIFFFIVGMAIVIGVVRSIIKNNAIKKKGNRYKAKIYSYVDDTSVLVNGQYQVNCKVHYFDKLGVENEAIIPTQFARGSNEYPIGMTIDIFEYQGKYNFDPSSVRAETLDREDELMDDKPIDRAKIRMVAISCQSCGISYEAVSGYTAACPYCGARINAPKV